MIRTEELTVKEAKHCTSCGSTNLYLDSLEDTPTADFPVPHVAHGIRCSDCGFFLTSNENGLAYAVLNR